ncbi:cation:proton antiporter [Croceicoccus sp. F390]|uniref:Cation:proton antiporter n=1 Tax=Croceicoccus esteveae TaxID=3075597 RepID=A0ABU2ZKS1_9SPHN|nr:cation:proton antiporter [Croceicoccus sp. F390]MDT0576816.1 cation:proton antiporter [Croceicoccus sp. F390]
MNPYHTTLATAGAVIILAYWLPRFLSRKQPAASALLIVLGMVSFAFVPGLPSAIDPRDTPALWELTSELAVIIALFSTGLKIDTLSNWARWRPTVRMLAVAMPLTIGAVALLGWWAAGLTVAGAVLLGAVLAPTDPVLAGDIQVGPPTEGGEHPIRFTLTTEAGLNDGLAFPFVYLGLLLGSVGVASASDLLTWVAQDVIYRILVGTVLGAFIGWVLGRIIFSMPSGNSLAKTGSAVVAMAGVLLVYGVTELVEGYGFIACFVAGVALRRVEADHAFHKRLHDFNEAIEHALTSLLLVLIGGIFPSLWSEQTLGSVLIAGALVFIIRPAAGMLALTRTGLAARDRLVVAFYGVRGIGSIYYLGFAAVHLEFQNEGELWAIVALTILLSSMVHGLTAGAAVKRAEERTDAGPATGNRASPS